MSSVPVSVIVLAGGGSRRFGSDKLAARLPDGRTVLDHCLSGMPPAWDLVAVGPSREVPAHLAGRVRFVQESPVGGGPLAGIAAGMMVVESKIVAVAPGDTPRAGAVLPLLVDALRADPTASAAVLSDGEARLNPLLAAYRTAELKAALPADPAGRPARDLLALPHRIMVAPFEIRDIDTQADLPRE